MSDTVEPISDAQPTSNVVGINEKKRGRPKKIQDDSDTPPLKLSAGEAEYDLVSILEREPITDFTPFPLNQVPMFPSQFQIFRGNRKDEVCLVEIEEKTAFLTNKENIASDLSHFCGQLAGVCKIYNATLSRCKSVIDRWAYKKRPLQKIPPPWGFKSSVEVCFNRLPYDPIELAGDEESLEILSQYAPYFSELLMRVSNRPAFCAMIGSLFYLDASRKQALWLWGPPGGGKSQLAILLSALMGDASVSFENDDFDGAFWKADLIDKRAAYIDEGDPNFLNSNSFKALTGKRNKRINQKFIRAFEAHINTIIFASSNDAPSIPNDPALMCRVVPCWVKPMEESHKIPETILEERFKEEAAYIAGHCMRVYRRLCPSFGSIPFNQEDHLQQAIDNFESEFLDLLESRFEVGTNRWINSADFNNVLTAANVKDKTAFKKFLKNRHPEIKETRHNRYFKSNESTARGWGGISKKPFSY